MRSVRAFCRVSYQARRLYSSGGSRTRLLQRKEEGGGDARAAAKHAQSSGAWAFLSASGKGHGQRHRPIFLGENADAELSNRSGRVMGAQRHQEAIVRLPIEGGNVTVKMRVGALMGDPHAVHGFCRALRAAIEERQALRVDFDPMAEALVAKRPFLPDARVDLSLTKYADDAEKL
eukprot:7669599-Pyramimonas_sp.AAC.1